MESFTCQLMLRSHTRWHHNFPMRVLHSVNFLIWNQLVINRLTRISSNEKKYFMMVNVGKLLVNLISTVWQLSCLTFISKYMHFKWLCLLHPTNEARIPSNFFSINYISDQHWCPKFTLWDISIQVALIPKQITDPYTFMCSQWMWIGIFNMSTEQRYVNYFNYFNQKSLVRYASATPANVWRTLCCTTHPKLYEWHCWLSLITFCSTTIQRLAVPWWIKF